MTAEDSTAEDTAQRATPEVVRQRWKDGMDDTREQRRSYWIAHEFLRGNQWLKWDDSTQRLTPPADDGDVIRHTNNRLGPGTRTIMAKLHRRTLAFECPLTAADDASIEGAKLAQAVLEHTAREQDWERVREKANRLAWKGGTGLICVEWDGDAGGTFGFDPETKEPIGSGDICLTALSITEAVTEPGCDDIERAPWWIKCVALPPRVVQRIYGLKEPPEANATDASTYDVRSPWGRDGIRAKLASVLTLFERPSKTNPKGQVLTIVGDTVLHDGPWPYPWTDTLNVVAVTETPMEGRWNGDSVLWSAIPLQFELNRAHTNLGEHLEKVGFAQRVMPQGSVEQELTDDPADIIEYAPGMGQPGYLQPPQLPTWVTERVDQLKRDIDDVLGVHDISRGQAPAGVDAGVALALLAEQDDTPVGRLSSESGRAWGKVASKALECYARYVIEGEKREALVRLDRTAPQRLRWDGSMLAGQTVAEVPQDVTAPRSQAAHQQFAFSLWDRHAFVDEEGKPDPQALLAFMNVSGISDPTEQTNKALAKYRRQNAEMFSGRACLPETFDDHALAIKVINEARFTARYEQSPDDIRALFDQKALAHQMLATEEMDRQAALSEVAPQRVVAAQADEPPLAGEAQTLANLQPPTEEPFTRGPTVGGAGGDSPFMPDQPAE